MANPEHVAILKAGVETWNKWRREFSGVEEGVVDLAGVNLREAGLPGVNFRGANLSETDLSRANLQGADLNLAYLRGVNFRRANLHGVNLRQAHLSGAVIRGADFTEVDLSGADLRGADLIRGSFRGANFSNVKVGSTIFGDIDLSQVKALLSVEHVGPSTIGIDTIYKSKGEIPQAFLRGAGVPDHFITYARSLVGQAIEFYSCFISYSSKDQPFADQLYADLQSRGVRCWFAPHDIQGGKKIHEQIDEAIRLYDKLLLVLSLNSVNSEWVNTEISQARKREIQEKRRMLFPLRLVDFETLRDWKCFDADTGKDSAREIREFFIPDFSHWKDHDSYQTAFQRLLSDLKAEAGRDAPTKTPSVRSGEGENAI